MELKKDIRRLSEYISRYKYVSLIVILGVLMLLIPCGEKKPEIDENTGSQKEQQISFQEQLSNILSCVSGAGRVEVMLSVSEGEEIVYQTDDNITTGSNSETNNKKIVTVTDAERNQQGLIKQTIPATYKGVIVVCQGADDASVRLNIINAVSRVTGLGSDKISVLKMK